MKQLFALHAAALFAGAAFAPPSEGGSRPEVDDMMVRDNRPMIITPTVGRVVYYWPDGQVEGAQPYAVLVTYVHGTRDINCAGWDHEGQSFRRTRVQLVQEGDKPPRNDGFCTWMPYQLERAKEDAANKFA